MLQKQKRIFFVYTNFRRVKQKQVVKVNFVYTDDDDKSKDGDCALTMTNENKLKALYRSLP